MEFIKNHFYKLTKEIPKRQSCEMPSWFNGAYDGIYGNSYALYAVSSYFSPVNLYEACKRFTIDNTYQATSSTSLYDDTGFSFTLHTEEIECFEEVDIGLSEISKKFMEKHINSGKMLFHFRFYNDNMVILNISLNGKYCTSVSLIGTIYQINEIVRNAYTELRKSYIKKFKINLDANYRWASYIYDLKSRGIFGGQL